MSTSDLIVFGAACFMVCVIVFFSFYLFPRIDRMKRRFAIEVAWEIETKRLALLDHLKSSLAARRSAQAVPAAPITSYRQSAPSCPTCHRPLEVTE